MRARVTVTRKRSKEFERFLAEMRAASAGPHVTVGVHEIAGEYPKKPGSKSEAPSVVDVAVWNEFGTESIPSRPFIRNVLHTKRSEINVLRAKLAKQIFGGKITIHQALEVIGFRVQQWIVNQISGRSPFEANAPSTIAAKKADNVSPPNKPLYHTGLLMRSIGYKVQK